MATPIRTLRTTSGIPMFWWFVIILALIGTCLYAINLYHRQELIAPFPILEAKPVVVNADDRVVCYVFPSGVSCLPSWLLDRPNNWIVAYPQSKPTGKAKP